MAVTPNTQIRLLSVPFEIDNKNQLTFNNITAQTNYFTSLPNLEIEECSYQRKDNIIKWPAHIDTILNYNYVMYKNKNYSNKWFYAFIDKMEYENNGTTNISIKQDVFQTWQFDLLYKKMFVEREHVNTADDIVGNNTIPEGLQLGEYISNKKSQWINSVGHNPLYNNRNMAIVVGATSLPNGTIPRKYATELKLTEYIQD